MVHTISLLRDDLPNNNNKLPLNEVLTQKMAIIKCFETKIWSV
jgi:hypothetical protein